MTYQQIDLTILFIVFLTIVALWGLLSMVSNDMPNIWKYSVMAATFLMGIGAIGIYIPDMRQYAPLYRSVGVLVMTLGALITEFRRDRGAAENTNVRRASIRSMAIVGLVVIVLMPLLSMLRKQQNIDIATVVTLSQITKTIDDLNKNVLRISIRMAKVDSTLSVSEKAQDRQDSLFRVQVLRNQNATLRNQAKVKADLSQVRRNSAARPTPIYTAPLRSRPVTPELSPERVKPVPVPPAPKRRGWFGWKIVADSSDVATHQIEN